MSSCATRSADRLGNRWAVARQAARSAEREAIAKVLEDTRWNRVKAAKLLRISYRALLYKIKDVGLDRPRPESPSSN